METKHKALSWSLWGIIPFLNIVAALSLFRLRQKAYTLFCSILGISLINAAVHFSLESDPLLAGSRGLAGVILGYMILMAVCFYARHLKTEGVLG